MARAASTCHHWHTRPGLCQSKCRKKFDCANPPAGYVLAHNRYWRRTTGSYYQRYEKALSECQNDGADLAAVTSQAEFAWVRANHGSKSAL